MSNLSKESVGSIVAQNWKMASVFQKYGIDFCCMGEAILADACRDKGVDLDTVMKELVASFNEMTEPEPDYNGWGLDLLADYIESKHHKYAADIMPRLLANLNKICTVHGENHPELFEIRDLFRDVSHELTVHMKREEFMIFPVIKKMVSSLQKKQNIPSQTYGTIQNPIAVMMQDHEREGDRLRTIARLSDNYTPPIGGCSTYKVSFSMLEDFERDLHKHIHLENNILFPKAILLEKDLAAAVC
jgi:regulator of cell morphogenesis and NO signaling